MLRFLLVVVMVVATLLPSQAQGPVGPAPITPGGGYPQVTSSHCRYLVNAPSPWGTNASPFKLYTRSYSGEIRRGYPVEVSILPHYEAFKFFNFTDFALWAEPLNNGAPPPAGNAAQNEMWGGGATQPAYGGPAAVTHLGVWQVFPRYAGGAGSMKCNMYSKGEDTVGSFEERMLELLKTQFPFDGRLTGFTPSARHGAAFLWYPDERTMSSTTAIKFVAKLKSFGQWFTLESTPWRVFRPPPRRRSQQNGQPGEIREFGTFVDRYSNMANQMRIMESRLERAGAPGI